MFSQKQIQDFLALAERRGPWSSSEPARTEKVVNKTPAHSIPSSDNGAEKRVKDSRADIGKEIRSICP